MTQIKTSSWFTKLPPDHVRIGISRGVPSRQKGFRRYQALNPGPWFKSVPPAGTSSATSMRSLGALNPETVVYELTALAEDGIPTLLCWEATPPSQDWCHGGLVSAWLHDELGLEVVEYGHEQAGFGWQHPKLLPEMRA